MGRMVLILGLDPGLGTTGWGLISAEGNRLSHVANGQIRTDPKQPLAARLLKLDEDLGRVIGKGGRVANAIRTIAKAAAVRIDRRVIVDILD